MRKIIPYIVFLILVASVVSAAKVVRELPSSVGKGEEFTLTYRVSDVSGTWGVIIEDDISGGCTHNILGTNLDFGWMSDDGFTTTKTIKAPSTSGECVFSGNFVFGTSDGPGTETDFLIQKVTIGNGNGDECTLDCEFYEECSKDKTKCQIAMWVWIVVVLFIVFIFFAGRKKR